MGSEQQLACGPPLWATVVRRGAGVGHNQSALTAFVDGSCVEVPLAGSFSTSTHPQLGLASLKS